jgi:hypothetical protein
VPRVVWTDEAVGHLEAIVAYIETFNRQRPGGWRSG